MSVQYQELLNCLAVLPISMRDYECWVIWVNSFSFFVTNLHERLWVLKELSTYIWSKGYQSPWEIMSIPAPSCFISLALVTNLHERLWGAIQALRITSPQRYQSPWEIMRLNVFEIAPLIDALPISMRDYESFWSWIFSFSCTVTNLHERLWV